MNFEKYSRINLPEYWEGCF